MNYLIFPKPKNKNPDNAYGVTNISKDKDGKVWIATYAALFNYDGKMVNVFDNEKLNLSQQMLPQLSLMMHLKIELIEILLLHNLMHRFLMAILQLAYHLGYVHIYLLKNKM